MPNAGLDSPSEATRIFMPTTRSLTSCVESPVTVSSDDSGAGLMLVMARWS